MPWILAAGVIGVLVALWQGFWQEERQALVDAELERERGRIWGMTCAATHRAVQAGLVTTARRVTPAELRAPPAPFRPFLPAGLNAADAGAAVTAGYGAVVVDGVAMAVCALTGADIAVRGPSLREGAVMAGLERVGFVGGDATPMHGQVAALEAVLGALGADSMFVTADFGIGHASERVHRRAIGGRPELSTVAQDIGFRGGTGIRRAGRIASVVTEAAGGSMPATARAEASGDVIVGSSGRFTVRAVTALEADGGFAFGGGTQTAFSIPQALSVGTSMRSRGAVEAGSVTLSGRLDTGGALQASTEVRAAGLVLNGEVSAVTATFTGNLDVPGGCSGCVVTPVGGGS